MDDGAKSKTGAGRPDARTLADAPSPEAGSDTPDDRSDALFEEIGAGSDTPSGTEPGTGRGIEAMMDVRMDVQIVLGHARMPIAEILKLGRGSVVQLDRQIGEPVDIVVNDMLVARGNLVKLAGDRIGVTLTELMRGSMAEV